MIRLKAVFIKGLVGKEFFDVEGVLREARIQGKRILKTNNIHILELIPSRFFEGYVALISGGSNGWGGNRREADPR